MGSSSSIAWEVFGDEVEEPRHGGGADEPQDGDSNDVVDGAEATFYIGVRCRTRRARRQGRPHGELRRG